MHPNNGQKRDQEQPATSQGCRHFKLKENYQVHTPESREVELYAKIKRTSKYYFQGLDENGKPRAYKIDAIQNGSHSIRMNSDNYRCRDLSFWVKEAKGKLIPLAGGKR